MGLHRIQTKADMPVGPVVSISLGDEGSFPTG